MARVLIVFESRYGSTARIASRLAGRLEADGHAVTLRSTIAAEPSLLEADAVIIAAPVYLARHPRAVRRFVRRHARALNSLPCALVSVCGALGGRWPEGPPEARRYVEHFMEYTGLHPDLVLSVAGTIAYTRYGPFTRWFMSRASAWTGRPTDTSRDHELTEWSDVDRLAATFSTLITDRIDAAACCAAPHSASPEIP